MVHGVVTQKAIILCHESSRRIFAAFSYRRDKKWNQWREPETEPHFTKLCTYVYRAEVYIASWGSVRVSFYKDRTWPLNLELSMPTDCLVVIQGRFFQLHLFTLFDYLVEDINVLSAY